MSRRQVSARAFLSLAAGVEDESESSDGFEDELDEQEASFEGICSSFPPSSFYLYFEESGGVYAQRERAAESSLRLLEEESAEDMAARYRRIDRDSRNKDRLLQDAFDTSVGATQARLPCAKDDISMFGMICKVPFFLFYSFGFDAQRISEELGV